MLEKFSPWQWECVAETAHIMADMGQKAREEAKPRYNLQSPPLVIYFYKIGPAS